MRWESTVLTLKGRYFYAYNWFLYSELIQQSVDPSFLYLHYAHNIQQTNTTAYDKKCSRIFSGLNRVGEFWNTIHVVILI